MRNHNPRRDGERNDAALLREEAQQAENARLNAIADEEEFEDDNDY